MYYIYDIWMQTNDALLTILVFVGFILAAYLAIVPHELAHGLAAKANGDLTAKVRGRLTMNPMAHFDPIGFLMIATMGFGFAKPVPINPLNFHSPRKGMFTVSIAGVLYNLAAVVVGCFLAVLVSSLMLSMTFIDSAFLWYTINFFFYFFSLFTVINASLFFFNILPIAPLDGFRMLESFTRRDNAFVAFLRNYGMFILIGLIALGIFADYAAAVAPWMAYFDVLGLYLSFFVDGIIEGLSIVFSWIIDLFIG